MNRHRNFSEKIIKKYDFFRKSGRLPALVFLRLFGLGFPGKKSTVKINKSTVERNVGSICRINNYFKSRFYTELTRELIKTQGYYHFQDQYNSINFYESKLGPGKNILLKEVIHAPAITVFRGQASRQLSAPQKTLQVSGGSIPLHSAVQRNGLPPAFYTITGSGKPAIISTRHIMISYLQTGFNGANTGSGASIVIMKEPLTDKSAIPEASDFPVSGQEIRNNRYEDLPEKYKAAGENILYPVLTPISSAKDTGSKKNTAFHTFPSLIRNSAKKSISSELTQMTQIKTGSPAYRHALSERADTGLMREKRTLKTIIKENDPARMVLNVRKMNERLSGRKQDVFPGNVARAAKPDLHFAGNSGKTEKPVRIEDTIDTIVRKHTDLVLRKTPGDKITNNVNKPDIIKTAKEEIRDGDINKSIYRERKQGEINTIADTVYKLIERRLLIEKEKRGLV